MMEKTASTIALVGSLLVSTPAIAQTNQQDTTTQDQTRPTFNHYDSNVSSADDAQVILIGHNHNTPNNTLGELVSEHTEAHTQILHEQPPGGHLDSLDFRNPQGMDELIGSSIMQNKEQWDEVYKDKRKAFTLYGIDTDNKADILNEIGDYLLTVIADDYIDNGCQTLHPVERKTIEQSYRPQRDDETVTSYVDNARQDARETRDSTQRARQNTLEDNMMKYVKADSNTIVTTGRQHITGNKGSSLTDPLRSSNTPYYAIVEEKNTGDTGTHHIKNIINRRIESLGMQPSAYNKRFQTVFKLDDSHKPHCYTSDSQSQSDKH